MIDRHPQSRSLEQAYRAALENHVHWPSRMGSWVLINVGWYNVVGIGAICSLITSHYDSDIRARETECPLMAISRHSEPVASRSALPP